MPAIRAGGSNLRGRIICFRTGGLAEALGVRLATGPRQNNGIFYEIRTYDIKPAKMKEFLEMVSKYFHFRTAHSELVGFWYSELGAMNKVLHIWKYGTVSVPSHRSAPSVSPVSSARSLSSQERCLSAWIIVVSSSDVILHPSFIHQSCNSIAEGQNESDNFAHRTAVRHALANDKDWQGKFISAALPLVEKQHNEVAYLVPWCQLGKPPKEGGVYEWVTFQMKPGGPALWGEAFRAAINAHINTGYTKLIGVFHTEYGLLNRVHVLWWNESPDQRAAGRHSAHEDARVVAAVRDSVRFLESQQNVLLIPVQCSPLK
ncbi:protein NipSnap homolog 3A isoform X2 [Zonotrichia albicollis]|uniref:protein NipSnap homolog 3A isoform X2 n=1 Tax=Zonotrichia albicollis TaxID=44394 RepID=UPI003D8115E3